MLSLLRKPDIPFSREDANRFLPWVIGLMVCLVGLFLSVSITIGSASRSDSSLNINHFQVYIPYQEDGLQKKVKVVKALLDTFDAVESVRQISTSDMADLVEPWTGSSLELDKLPLPAVLEATLKSSANRALQMERIKSKLAKFDEEIDIEQYDEWVQQLWRFTDALHLLSLTLASCLIVGLVCMIILTARTSLKLHFSTVTLLHNVGATDDYIIKQFITNGVWMVFRGAGVGAGVAILITVLLSALSSELQSPLLPQFAMSPTHMAMFLILPVFSAIVAHVAVRVTVQTMLENMN